MFFFCYLDRAVSIVFQGALIGGVASLGFMSWVCLGTQAAIAAGEITFETKPVSVEGCTYDFVTTAPALFNSTMKPHKECVYHFLIHCLPLPESCFNESHSL